jgi:hypothetical protein
MVSCSSYLMKKTHLPFCATAKASAKAVNMGSQRTAGFMITFEEFR